MLKLNTEKLLEEINKRWTNKNCPMCSHNNWNVDVNLVTPLKIADKGGVELGGRVMPLIAVTCTNCGNVLFVNPLVIQCVENSDGEETK